MARKSGGLELCTLTNAVASGQHGGKCVRVGQAYWRKRL
jgi:hypothetical protein